MVLASDLIRARNFLPVIEEVEGYLSSGEVKDLISHLKDNDFEDGEITVKEATIDDLADMLKDIQNGDADCNQIMLAGVDTEPTYYTDFDASVRTVIAGTANSRTYNDTTWTVWVYTPPSSLSDEQEIVDTYLS